MDRLVQSDVANPMPRTNVRSSQTSSQLAREDPSLWSPGPFAANSPSNPPDDTLSLYNAVQKSAPSSPRLTSSLTNHTTQTDNVDLNATSFAISSERKMSSKNQNRPSLLTCSDASGADKVSSVTNGTGLSSATQSTKGEISSHGPLPDWAFFYDPVLSYEQVKYIESQMRPQEEYDKIPADGRQSVVVDDLQQALSSMRQVYSRSTEVVANHTSRLSGIASPETTIRQAQTRSAHYSAQGINVENECLAGCFDNVEPVGESHDVGKPASERSKSEMQRDDQAPTTPNGTSSAPLEPFDQSDHDRISNLLQSKIEQPATTAANHSPPQILTEPLSTGPTHSSSSRLSRGEPVYNMSKLSSSHVHGKRSANGDDVQPKRQRLHRTIEADENGRARVVSSLFHPTVSTGIAHGPDSRSQTFSAGKSATSPQIGLPAEPRSEPGVGLESSQSLESSDDDSADNQSLANDMSQGREWPPEDVAMLIEAHGDGNSWEFIHTILSRYSIPAAQNKLRQIEASRLATLSSHRSSVSDGNIMIGKDNNAPEKPLVTSSVGTSFHSKLSDKKFDQKHLAVGEAATAPRPESDGLFGVLKPQKHEAINRINFGAAKKGGVMTWSDEEVQLLIDLKGQDKPWEEVFEAIPSHTCAAIRTKYSNIRYDPKWTRKAQTGLKKPVHVTSNGPAKSGLFENEAPKAYSRLQKKIADRSKVFTTDLSGRSYSTVIDKFGRRHHDITFLLIPGNYKSVLHPDLPGLPWVCPIRSCRYAFHKSSSLDAHWARAHRKCLLNDNNDGTFSIKGEYEPKKVRTANALIISRNTLDPKEPPMAEIRSYRQVQMESTENQYRAESHLGQREDQWENQTKPTTTDIKHDPAVDESGVIGKVIIPEDLTMATNIRSYREWPDDTGTLVHTWGVPLPANYRLTEFRGFEWLCPIRACGRIVASLKSLGGHFSSGHPGILLNDNRDGTFSEVGRHHYRDSKQDHRTVMVKSKNPLPPDTPPRAAPNASPHNQQAQIDLAASIAEWEKLKATRAMATRAMAAKPTMDEILAGNMSSTAQIVKEDPESSVLSDAVTLPESYIPEPELTSAQDSEAGGAPELANNETEGELSDASQLATPIARENWDLIQALFTDKRFPPPQSGPLKELISLRRVRKIDFNPVATSKFSIVWPKDASLLIVQLVGHEASTKCGRCSKGHGIFSSCVVVPRDVANVLQSGICACVNCSWKSAYHKNCDIKKLLKDAGGVVALGDGPPPQTHVVGGTVQIAGGNSSDDERSGSGQSLGSKRSVKSLISVGSESDQPFRTRHSKRLKRNAQQDSGRRQSVVNTSPPPAADTGPPTIATARKVTHVTKVDKSFEFRVDVITPRTTLRLQSDVESLRICSLVMGKVKVKMQDEQTFDIGFQGMFRLLPGVDAEVTNSTGIDAVLQISGFRER